jgi:hypothetical protein
VTLSLDELSTFTRLRQLLSMDQVHLFKMDAYYEGMQRVEQLGLAVPPALRKFLTIVNWPRVTVDALEERIDLEGFRLPGTDDRDEDLWRVWQANGLDEESQLAHLDALVFGRSYLCVGANENDRDTPFVTVESPLEMVGERDPRTRAMAAALRIYTRGGTTAASSPRADYATLYLPDVTIWLESTPDTSHMWVEVDRDEHMLGVVPVVPLVNRTRTARRGGVSEMADVIPLTDAAARALTNAQLATETLAVPQRYVLGAQPSDFQDVNGNFKTQWETYFSSVWALMNDKASVGQFAAADLSNFTKIVEHYAGLVSSVSGLPIRYYGQNTANPPSEGSINADESRLIKRAERRERAWGGSWEFGMRLVRRIQEGEWDPDLASMETMWRDPSTPTRAQTADAVVKLASTQIGGVPILPLEMAREELGWSATKRERAELLDQASADQAVASLRDSFLNQPAPVDTQMVPAVQGAAVPSGQ